MADHGAASVDAAETSGALAQREHDGRAARARADGGGELGALPLAELVDRALGRSAARAMPLFAYGTDGRGRVDLARLARATPAELALRTGLPAGAAGRLAAAFELGRRVERSRGVPRPALRSAQRVHRAVAPLLRGARRERFLALLLDGKHRLQRVETVSIGTLTSSLVHPREVFGSALREAAAAVIVVHNHPSGDPEPSLEDVEVTRRLLAAGRLLGVPLLDHLVVADRGYVSLRERIDFSS